MTKRHATSRFLLGVLAFIFMGLGANVQAQATSIPNKGLVISKADGYAADSVLVKFRFSATAADRTRARGLINAIKPARSYQVESRLEKLGLLPGRQSVMDAVDRLSSLPFVEYAQPDFRVRKVSTNDPLYGLLYAIENTGQEILSRQGIVDADMDVVEAWATETGDPELIIAVIDEGVDYAHEDLATNMWVNTGEIPNNNIDDDGNGFIDDVHGYDFFADDGDPMPDDGEGHGTHVAGTICAEGNNGIGIVGVVQQCKIMSLRFLGPNGGFTSDAIAAIDYAVAMGAKISNNSWGSNYYDRALEDAISAADAANHIFVAAAGNDGVDTDIVPHYPSSFSAPNIVSVAATNNRDGKANFSNYGATSVDIGAPGNNIVSTYPNNSYVWLSGTSMAGPNVTGVLALIWSKYPEWSHRQVIDHLYATGRPVAALAGITSTGKVANAESAVAIVAPPSPPAVPSGLMVEGVTHDTVSLSWADNADNEDAFLIERNGQVLAQTVNANVLEFTDTGLTGSTSYTYRVKARNAAGDSPWSNQAEAITDEPPLTQTIRVNSETTVAGRITAESYLATFEGDGLSEIIRERRSKGKPRNRYSYLDHRWVLSAPAGLAQLDITGFADASGDGDSFELFYSTGAGFNFICTLETGSPAPCSVDFDHPGGNVIIRVTDTDQTPGNKALESVSIDEIKMLIDSTGGPSLPPAAPTGLSADSSQPGVITLFWTDEADNESSYKIERSENSGATWVNMAVLSADTTTWDDNSVASLSTYLYRVSASNGYGEATSGSIEVTSAEIVEPNIILTATAYSQASLNYVDLSWDTGNKRIKVRRNGQRIYAGRDGQYTDSLGAATGVFNYQACPGAVVPPDTTGCSDVITVEF
jgi:serine protease